MSVFCPVFFICTAFSLRFSMSSVGVGALKLSMKDVTVEKQSLVDQIQGVVWGLGAGHIPTPDSSMDRRDFVVLDTSSPTVDLVN